MRVDTEEILVVNGAQQGLELVCKALLDPGDAVVVESPPYSNLLALLRLYRADILPVPMTAYGIALEQLDALLERRRVKFLYTMPHFQNPTGITTQIEHRKRLLHIASHHGLAILEDGFEEELRWDGGEVLPLRALGHDGRVCYVGTFSKGLCPGFRIGWLVADRELVTHLSHLKRTTDFHSSVLLQAALAEFCHRGEYDRHLRRLRKVYRARMARTAEALTTHMPAGTRWRLPAGGFCVWLELPPGVADEELAARAARDRTRPARAVIVSTHQLKDKSALRTHRTVLFRKLLPAWLMLLRNGGGRVSLSKQLRVTWSSLCGQQQGRLFINSRLIKARLSKDEIGMLWGFWDTQQKRASGVYLAAFPWVSSIKLDAQKPLQSAMYLARKQRKGARIYKPGKKLIALILLLTQLSMRLAQMQRKPFVLKSYRKRLKALLS